MSATVSLLPSARVAPEPVVPEPPASDSPDLLVPEELSPAACRACRMMRDLCEFHRGVTAHAAWMQRVLTRAREEDVR